MTCFADLPLVLKEQINLNDQVKDLDAKQALIEKMDFGHKVYLLECDDLLDCPLLIVSLLSSNSFLIL